MAKVVLIAFALLAATAALTRAPRARRALWIAVCIIVAYGVLKATGIIEALAPARDGVS